MTNYALPAPRLHARALAAALLLCGTPLTPWAQQTPQAQAATADALPVVRTKAAAETESATGPVLGYTAKRSATATKTDTPLNEVPQSISVITADQIRDQNAQTMQEVLRYSAGVRSEMYGLDNRGDWFSLRGGSEGSTLLDGLRLPLTGWYGVVRNEPYAFERIEVLRGPASVVAGQNGPGGVVNLVSKRPQAESLRELGIQLGSDSHKQIYADLGGALNSDASLTYRLVALVKDSDTQVEHAFDKRRFLAPSLSWQPAAGSKLTVYGEYQKDETGNTNAFFPIEGTLRPGPHGYLSPHTFIGEPDWDSYGGERKRLGYEWEQRLNEQWKLSHRLRHDRIDGRMRTMYAAWWLGYADATGASDPNGRYMNRIWYATDDTGRITNTDLLLEGKLKFGATQHTLLLGVDAMRSRSTQKSWEDAATPLNVYDPVYGSFALPVLPDVEATVSRVRQWGLIAQDQIKFGQQWVLVAGLRHDKARSGDAQKDSASSKNLGLVHLMDGGWSPYASYSESFEPVGGTDAAGKAFKPKRGKQVEAGLKWAPGNRNITAAAALYQLEETNRLTTDPLNVGFSVQRGKVKVKGLELELNASLRAWDLIASYSHMDARQSEVSSEDVRYLDKQLSGIPRHSASLWALHRLDAYGLSGFKAGAGLRYVGKTSDGVDITTTPSYTLVDLMVSWDRGPWHAALNIANVGDKTYIATCLERGDCWYGSQRRAVASLAYRW